MARLYDGKFRHVPSVDNCIGCHNQHSLQVRIEKCQECHTDVKAVEDLKTVRMNGSLSDYNGNGDVKEGIASEIAGMQDTLYKGIQEYAKTVAGAPIVYDAASYPYFLADADEDGKADVDDKGAAISYKSWTPRLLKAAYNYQTSVKDPGAFAHNAKYIIELLYDSTADLNEKLGTIDMSMMQRNDPGHFAGNTEPFRHWDEEGEVARYLRPLPFRHWSAPVPCQWCEYCQPRSRMASCAAPATTKPTGRTAMQLPA